MYTLQKTRVSVHTKSQNPWKLTASRVPSIDLKNHIDKGIA